MIVFLVRQFNDIDHIVPIVYRLLKDGKSDVRLFCMNIEIDTTGDFRLKYLYEKFHFRTRYIYEASKPSLMHHLYCLLVCRVPRMDFLPGLGWLGEFARNLARRVHASRITGWLYDVRWASRYLEKNRIRAVVVDYGQVTQFIYRAISEAADKLGIAKIGAPHGLQFWLGEYWTDRELTKEKIDYGKQYGWMNCMLVESDHAKKAYSGKGYPAERIHVLGSTRFCDEWQGVYEKIVPRSELPEDDGRLKVIYFDHGSQYRMHLDEVSDSLKAVAELDFVNFIFKPNPRFGRPSIPSLEGKVQIDSHSQSLELIRWADVVVNIMSTIFIEAYRQKKIFLYPGYFTDNHFYYEQQKVCWIVSSRDEFLAALRGIHEKTMPIPYSEDDVRSFERKVIYGGEEGADVLGKYSDFVLNHPYSSAGSREAGPNRRGQFVTE